MGITAAKQKLARATGIPTTRGGRRRKFGPFGLFALVGLILGAAKAGSNAQSHKSPASGGGVSTGCIGCVVVGGVLALGVFVGCGGLLSLGALTTRDHLPHQHSPRNAFGSQPQPVDIPAAHRISTSENSRKLPVPSTLHRQITVDTASANKHDGAENNQLPLSQPDPHPILDTLKPTRPVRTWTSADGKFTVEAEFISFGAGKVKLRRVDNGKELNLDANHFSPADIAWIKSRL
ncbi:SHD1 domain-containing protein [Anatilimnocola floriformis]|uniref:SHD1 domain-containing protein n=1 Tax=Anatilimnocola floriformis TaxID=2948575 RepID=UPI0020C2BD59|nr:SHD1 domain-containing protein [Anatilimnocola floriformis]